MTNELPHQIADIVAQMGGPFVFRMAFRSMVFATIRLQSDHAISVDAVPAAF